MTIKCVSGNNLMKNYTFRAGIYYLFYNKKKLRACISTVGTFDWLSQLWLNHPTILNDYWTLYFPPYPKIQLWIKSCQLDAALRHLEHGSGVQLSFHIAAIRSWKNKSFLYQHSDAMSILQFLVSRDSCNCFSILMWLISGQWLWMSIL